MSRGCRARGVTLVELIVAIVVIGAGVAGILKVMDVTTRRSADPMLVQQAQLIAESYLEEILLKKFVDPEDDKVCPGKEPSRSLYDNVCDYHGLSDAGAVSQLGGAAVTGLERYNVSVTVLPNSGATPAVALGSLSNDYGAGHIRVLQVTVVVTHADFAGVTVTLTGYRTNYNCNATSGVGLCRPLT